MKAVICAINSKYVHSSLAPWYLSAAAAAFCKSDVQCQVLEGTINQNPDQVINRITQAQPDVLAFSCYIWNIEYVKRLLPTLSAALPNVPIILGGPEVSFCAEEVLQDCPGVDFVLIGEGEKSFAMLLDCLRGEENLDCVPSLAYRSGSEIVFTEAPAEICSQPPSPYSPEYFDALGGRIAYLETSRGCPFSCSFCLSGRRERVRFFDLDRAKSEMLLLAASGAKTIKLVDRTFNCNAKRAYEILDFLIGEYGKGIPEDVRFHFEVGADLFDQRTLDLLATAPAGLFQIEAGLQSFNAETLEAVQRKTNMDKLTDNLRSLISAGNVHVHIDLIAGLPYETSEIFRQSFNKAFALRPHMLQLGFLKMLHGSRIRGQAEEFTYRFSPTPPYEFESNLWFSQEEKSVLDKTEEALDRLYNSGRFLLTLDYLLSCCDTDAFELFHGFGEYFSRMGRAGITLEDFTALVLEYFSGAAGVERGRLRDVMVCDRLRCENTGRVPPCLHIPDPETKRALNTIRAAGIFGEAPRLALARLYHSEHEYVLADYSQRDAISGHYKLLFFTSPQDLSCI